jgi:hypothetical protein
MAVDEFGREVPAGRGPNRRSPSPPPFRGDGAPTHLSEALPTSRYAREDRPSNSNRKRKHRSESPPRRKPTKPHPSTVYAEAPMLCQFLWKEANPDKQHEEYDEYRRSYCLNYVRTFFNEHMDDSWFRSLYSPLEKYRVAILERERSLQDAQTFSKELKESLENKKSDSEECFFVLKARLGGGVKQPSSYSSSPSKKSTSSNMNPVPVTHVPWCASQVLPIKEVRPHVTDEQLTMALMSHCTVNSKPSEVTMYSSAPAADLSRSCYFLALPEVRKDIINNLNHLGRTDSKTADGAHVPRKEDTYIPKTLELEVECSDAYGRLEIDADGKGGAPKEGTIPPRKAVVWVSTQPITPPVKVLSVAVSSKERIAQDKESALKLAKAYDAKRNIPTECRLETILPQAIPGLAAEQVKPQDLEDALDVSIAYLRRVHLFSFYNGCVAASNIADVFHGNKPTSTIHLRLANADEILQQTKDDNAATATTESTEPPKVDLLVQRLNDLIEKALAESYSWDESSSSYLVSKEVDTDAKNIEQQGARVEDRWIQAHAMIDEDGRARCAFHFCKKLFKDGSFLQKHLIKKHSDFLKSEIAKCHDTYMMTSWDKQEQRPVPPILVDCGRAFSMVRSPVLGAAEPMAADPEPELWRRQEERRKQEEEEEQARRERHQHHREQNDGPPPSLDGPLSEPRGPRQNTFVDVDDMKEEKIEMAFEKVEIPVQPPNKKRKKKKLL